MVSRLEDSIVAIEVPWTTIEAKLESLEADRDYFHGLSTSVPLERQICEEATAAVEVAIAQIKAGKVVEAVRPLRDLIDRLQDEDEETP